METDSLGLLASDSHIIIASTQNENVNGKYKSSIQVMKKPIAEIWEEWYQASLAHCINLSVNASHSLN